MKYIVIKGCDNIETINGVKTRKTEFEDCIGIYDSLDEATGKAYNTLQKIHYEQKIIFGFEDIVPISPLTRLVDSNDDEYGKIFYFETESNMKTNLNFVDYTKILYYRDGIQEETDD